MGTYTTTVFSPCLKKIAEGDIDLSTVAISAMLTNSAPNTTTYDELADITEIATGGGYTQGTGLSVTVSSSAMNGTDYELTLSGSIGFTASGTVATFRYVCLAFLALSGDPLFVMLDLGTTVDMTTNDVLDIDVDGVVIITFAP